MQWLGIDVFKKLAFWFSAPQPPNRRPTTEGGKDLDPMVPIDELVDCW